MVLNPGYPPRHTATSSYLIIQRALVLRQKVQAGRSAVTRRSSTTTSSSGRGRLASMVRALRTYANCRCLSCNHGRSTWVFPDRSCDKPSTSSSRFGNSYSAHHHPCTTGRNDAQIKRGETCILAPPIIQVIPSTHPAEIRPIATWCTACSRACNHERCLSLRPSLGWRLGSAAIADLPSASRLLIPWPWAIRPNLSRTPVSTLIPIWGN